MRIILSIVQTLFPTDKRTIAMDRKGVCKACKKDMNRTTLLPLPWLGVDFNNKKELVFGRDTCSCNDNVKKIKSPQ